MVIDASVWVSGLITHDASHPASRRWLDQHLRGGGVFIEPTLFLPEVAGAVARQTGLPRLGHQAVEDILQTPGLHLIPLDAPLAEETARTAAALRIRGADAVYVTVAHVAGVPLITWDKELQSRAVGFIQVVHP